FVISDVGGRLFSEDDLQILTIFANQAAIAIQNAQLYDAIRLELTERPRAEKVLRLTQERYRDLFEHAPVMYVITGDREGEPIILDCNELFLHTLGYRRAQVLGRPLADFYTPGSRRQLLQGGGYQQALRGEFVPEERQLVTCDGRVIETLLQAVPKGDEEGRVSGTHAMYVNITERKRAAEALADRTRQLEAVRTVTEEITRELELTTLLRLINRRAAELVGSVSGVVWLWNETAQCLVPEAWHGFGGWLKEVRLRLGEGVAGTVAQRREGLMLNDYRTSTYAHPLFLEHTGITAVLAEPLLYHDRLLGAITVDNQGVGRHFSEQDRNTLSLFAAQAAIAIENARLLDATERAAREARSLYEIAHSLTTSLDPSEVLHLISVKTTELLGTPHAQVVLWDEEAHSLRLGAAYGSEAEQVRTQEFRLGEGVNGIVAETRASLIVNDYQNFPHRVPGMTELVAVIGVPLLYRDRFLGVLTSHATQPGAAFTQAHLALLTSFADQAAIAIQNAQLFSELNLSYRDLQQAQDELIRSEKLRALGQMAAGIAHDLNNILAAVLARVELLRFRVADPEIRETLKTLETAVTDGAHVVRRLQDFARQRARSPLVPTDLARAVQETLEMTRPHWRDEPHRQGRVIEVRTLLDGISHIQGNAPEVREAVTNLILNAVDAMPQGGVLTLNARQVKKAAGNQIEAAPSPGASRDRPRDNPGEWVELTVTDTGTGMSEEIRRRIFEPFFTTKGMHGTGLGLAVVYGIMERHGGHIHVASVPGRGSTVTLQFQAALGPVVARQKASATVAGPRRILLIDDDSWVRESLSDLLRTVGHHVTEADGGAAGLAHLVESPVDLVLTDLVMPEVSGWDIARAIKSRLPGLPVVLMTGWGDQVVKEASERGLVDRVLGKPFPLEEILRVIRELTADRPSAGSNPVGTES
ncbi:MAG: GAF domain-containing protein, partial [candidate division NC10 bacterium]|nr:GAF domain-containing protein [candidate division NC10 bacterium]